MSADNDFPSGQLSGCATGQVNAWLCMQPAIQLYNGRPVTQPARLITRAEHIIYIVLYRPGLPSTSHTHAGGGHGVRV